MVVIFKISKKVLVGGSILLLFMALFFSYRQVNAQAVPPPIERVDTEEKVIALTVNVDWGEEYIPKMLDVFDQYNAKVTFFVTGRWAKLNPELLKEMAARGHQIENHGYSHPHPDQLSVQANIEELRKTETVIYEITGHKTSFYAPPYGERVPSGLKAAAQLRYRTVLWTLDTIDWRPESTPDVIAQRILNPAPRHGEAVDKRGAIVLMHPKESTVQALPVILQSLTEQGFKAVSISQLITLAE